MGVVRIKFFSSATAEDVREKVASLLRGSGSGKSGSGGVSAIVLDLRGNPGGLLQGGADTARLFLPKGSAIVSVRDNKGTEDKQIVDRDLVERAQEDGGAGADGSFAKVLPEAVEGRQWRLNFNLKNTAYLRAHVNTSTCSR